jgi:ubiquitin carboxyl-terminal hydrolase 7
MHDLEAQGLYSNPIQFYDFLQNRVLITFRPKFDAVDDAHPEFDLTLSKKMHYETVSGRTSCPPAALTSSQMANKVGEHLRRDPVKIRFTTTHPTNGSPKAVLKRQLNPSISEIMSPAYVTPQATVILYELLDVSIVELETKRSLKILWTGVHNKEEASHSFLLPKTNSVNDLIEHLSKVIKLTPDGTGKIRIFEISKDGKAQKEFTGSEMIGNIPEVDLYAEVSHLAYHRFCNAEWD